MVLKYVFFIPALCMLCLASLSFAEKQEDSWEKIAEQYHARMERRCGKGTNSALRDKLHALYQKDQQVRNYMITLPSSQWTEQLAKAQQETDRANTRELQSIVAANGWPGCKVVGLDASNQAILIANHSADHAWQLRLLPQLESLARRDQLGRPEVATFTDKVLVAAGRKQRYGMNFKFEDGKLMMYAVEDPAHLAQRRSRALLPPLAEYRKMLAEIYHLRDTGETVSPNPQ